MQLAKSLPQTHLVAGDEVDREVVDQLVQELKRRPKVVPPAPKPAPPKSVFAAVAAAEPVSTQPPPPAAPTGPVPGRRFSTATLLMPAIRKERKNPFAFVSAIPMPALPKIALRTLEATEWSARSVRVFVGLGVLFAAAMRYWP